MSHDRSTVEAVVKNYFDGLYEGELKDTGEPVPPKWFVHGLFA